jgi:hypothetical protein
MERHSFTSASQFSASGNFAYKHRGQVFIECCGSAYAASSA